MKGMEMFRTFLICAIFIGFCLVPLASSEENGDEVGGEMENVTDEMDEEMDNVTEEVVVDEEMDNVTEEVVVDEEMDNVTEEVVVDEEVENVTDGMDGLDAMIAADENLSIMTMAVEVSGMEQLLAIGGPYTVFTPSDEAFEAFGLEMADNASVENESAENESVETEPVENESTENASAELVYILANHIVLGEYNSTALVGMAEENGTMQTLAGENLTLTLDAEGGLMVNNITVIMPDVEAENGVIHVIDGVLLPEGMMVEDEVVEEEVPIEDEVVEDEVVEEEILIEDEVVEDEVVEEEVPIEDEVVEDEVVEEEVPVEEMS